MSQDLIDRLNDEAGLLEGLGFIGAALLAREAADRIEQQVAQIEQLRAEVERLRADAERYRWVRITPTWIGFDADYRPDEVDAVVDRERSAALAEGK